MATKQYFGFYDRINAFTVDEFGNIGRTMKDGTFNSNEIGTNTDTKTIIQVKENMDILTSGSRPLEVYYLGNNIIKIFGQTLTEIKFISA
jgi:hypothetical protein